MIHEMIPMPFGGKDVPHIVIEVNQTCNISCKACYKNIHPSQSKTTTQIKQEIDLAISQRNLDMLTLAGGEPTLHPDIPELIRYVTEQGVKVNLLTNGLLLDDQRLAAYAAAGLSRVLVHIDSLQERPDAPAPGGGEAALNPLREQILGRAARHGIRGGLAVTLYRDNIAQLPELMDFIFACPWISLVLFTCCTKLSPIAERYAGASGPAPIEEEDLSAQEVTNREVLDLVAREFDLVPAHYIASSLRDTELRWLFYLAFAISDGDGRYSKFHLHGRYRRTINLANLTQKLLKGRYKFDMVPGPKEAVAVCLSYGIMGMDPRNLLHIVRFLSGLLRPGSRIRSKVIVVQQPPNLSEDGRIEHCRDCPDATVRNGRITPLCLADIVSPLD